MVFAKKIKEFEQFELQNTKKKTFGRAHETAMNISIFFLSFFHDFCDIPENG